MKTGRALASKACPMRRSYRGFPSRQRCLSRGLTDNLDGVLHCNALLFITWTKHYELHSALSMHFIVLCPCTS